MVTSKDIVDMRAVIALVREAALSMKGRTSLDFCEPAAMFICAAEMMEDPVNKLESQIISYHNTVMREEINPPRRSKKSWPVKDL